MTSPIRDEANPFTCEVDLRSLLDSPREIADEILDLTTLLGVLLAGDDADTCLPGNTGSTVSSSSVRRP